MDEEPVCYKVGFPNIKGSDHTFFDCDNNLWVCGKGNARKLGLGDCKDCHILTPIPNIKALKVSSRYYHTMVIDIDNNVYSCGYYKNLGLNDLSEPGTDYISTLTQIPNIKGKQISTGYYYSLLTDINNNVWEIRKNVTIIPNLKASHIACGYDYNIVIGAK